MKALAACLAICAMAFVMRPVHAQAWRPEKPIEILIGLTAGSSQDRTGRALQKTWQEASLVSVPVTVMNRPGGGGQVAATALTQRPGDAHLLLVISPTLISRYVTGLGTLQFSDLTPLALLGNQYLAVAVRHESPLKSARDLMARLKREPHTFSIGVNSAGGTLHMMTAMIIRTAGGDPRKARIPTFQGGELMTAGIGGHVDAIVTVASNILPHVESGKLDMLGVAAPRRLTGALATVPTLREQGVDIVVSNWAGVAAPKALTAPQVAYWDGVLAATVTAPSWKAFVEQNLWEAEYLSSTGFVKHLQAEEKRLRAALTDLGLAKQ